MVKILIFKIDFKDKMYIKQTKDKETDMSTVTYAKRQKDRRSFVFNG